MIAIYKRELKSYFHTFIGFLFIAATLFFLGLYFTVYNLFNAYPTLAYTVGGCIFVFLISVPVLTMRVMADERRNRTDQLILTAPVTVGQVVVGKFLATLTVFVIPCAIICLYPLILSRFGTVAMGESYVAILAFFLFGMACIAMGVLISSLTENIVIAAVLSFLLLFLGYMMTSICSLISETGNLLTQILSAFDLYTPFESMLGGTLDLTAVVYFLTLTVLSLFLSTQAVQKRRYSVSVKQLRFGAYSVGTIAVGVAIAVFVNVVVGRIPETVTVLDVTANQLYTLTDQTVTYVNGMTEDVTIYVWSSEENADTTVAKTLERYASLSDHITVEYVDPRVNPRFYTNYTSSAPSSGSLFVVSDLRSTVIDADDLYEYTYSYDSTSYYGYSYQLTGYDAEGQITSALGYVLSDDMPVVYLTTGHGESSLDSSYTEALAKSNVDYNTINLMDYDAVPEDAAALMIYGATTDFSSDDVDKVIEYLENGGKVIVALTLADVDQPNLASLLDYMGLTMQDGLVVEENTDNYYRNPFYELPEISYSTYTNGVYGSYYLFMPYNVGVTVPEDSDTITYDVFLSSSDDSFLMLNYETATDYSQQEGDPDGPFALGVEAVMTLESEETDTESETAESLTATLIVISSASMFTEAADEMVSGANATVFMNIITAFADREVNLSIPVKSYEMDYLSMGQSSIIRLGVLTVVLLPLAFLITGFVIWLRRRKR